MKQFSLPAWPVLLIALLAAFSASVGLFSTQGNGTFEFTTLHGEVIQIYGKGLYQYDTPLIAIGYRASDAFILTIGIPLLLVSFWQYGRGSQFGKVMLTGVLLFFLYAFASLGLGASYNNLFLVYVLLTLMTSLGSAGLLLSFDMQQFASQFSAGLPRRRVSIFLITTGVVLFCIWLLLSIVPALLDGGVPPEVASYTTIITFVIDMALIAPVLVTAGLLLRRGEPLGYLLSAVLLIFIDALGLSLLVMGVVQQLAGLMNMGQFIGFVVSFAVLTLFSLRFTLVLFHNSPNGSESRRLQGSEA